MQEPHKKRQLATQLSLALVSIIHGTEMVIFISSKSAYEEMKSLIFSGDHSIWLASGVLTDEEVESILGKDIELSVLDYDVDTSDSRDLECAMFTIREHHPGNNIWVQYLN